MRYRRMPESTLANRHPKVAVSGRRRRWAQAMGLVLLLLTLFGCNSAAIYQDDLYNPPVYWGRHVVEQGDTLYSIAWRYGRDYRELAAANHIKPPYDVRPGEVIRLDLRGKVPSQAAGAPRTASAGSSSRHSPAKTSSRTSSRNKTLQTTSSAVSDINWRWPHVGPVIAGYSMSGRINKGIDIAGQAGDPVAAAADGEVVYAGSGLLGYGKLIIVNHNEHYLSAYAHNRKILVTEGDQIKAGQRIAEMGSTGASRVELHFEIRQDGKPVDPMRFLPARH